MLSKRLEVDQILSYKELYIKILDLQVKRLRKKVVATVKVLWRNHLVEGETWENESDMRSLPSLIEFLTVNILFLGLFF